MSGPQFELIDVQGQTIHENGTVGTSTIALNASQKVISEFILYCPLANDRRAVLMVSLDGGVKYRSLPWNSQLAWTPKGKLREIFVKANREDVKYECLINVEVD